MFNEIVLTAAITAAVMLVLFGMFLLIRKPDPLTQEVATRSANDPDFTRRLKDLLHPPKPPEPPRPSGEPLRLLALLQREGRLLDFLLEDIQAYTNEQIGAAVRDIHRNCHKAVDDHLVLAPVLAGEEQAIVEVPPGFDPSAIRLT